MAVKQVRIGDNCVEYKGYYGTDSQGNYGFIATSNAYPCGTWTREANGGGNDTPVFHISDGRTRMPFSLPWSQQSEGTTLQLHSQNRTFKIEEVPGKTAEDLAADENNCGCADANGSCTCNRKKIMPAVVAVAATAALLGAIWLISKLTD